MAVSEDDVRHVAELARLGLRDDAIPVVAAELSGILDHMQVLARVDTTSVVPVVGIGASGTPLRVDAGVPLHVAVPREAFAPAMRDGFFLVPRLATHGDAGDAPDPEESA